MAGSRRGVSPDVVLVVTLVLVHFTMYRFLVRWPAMPNFLIGGLLLAALHLRAGYAAFVGLCLGVLEAAMGLEGMGTISMVFTVLGYLAARSRDLLFADARYYVFIYLFFGTWVGEISLMVVMPGGPGLLKGLVLAPVSALTTAVVCGLAESMATNLRRP
ncbi:MAG: rod shape-determining protein MreD [Candidatus Palauibacterales bacterium]|nr:rod shape-determining protein MreD [Candidatus Palauibacterales bacterium]MDP2481921.1 rod shape-determining protein MreD [Candidatus Palauibacterales bacterium]